MIYSPNDATALGDMEVLDRLDGLHPKKSLTVPTTDLPHPKKLVKFDMTPPPAPYVEDASESEDSDEEEANRYAMLAASETTMAELTYDFDVLSLDEGKGRGQ